MRVNYLSKKETSLLANRIRSVYWGDVLRGKIRNAVEIRAGSDRILIGTSGAAERRHRRTVPPDPVAVHLGRRAPGEKHRAAERVRGGDRRGHPGHGPDLHTPRITRGTGAAVVLDAHAERPRAGLLRRDDQKRVGADRRLQGALDDHVGLRAVDPFPDEPEGPAGARRRVALGGEGARGW